MSKITKKFGENVRFFRIKNGVSQEDLAVQASLHRTYIGSIERGERNVSLENIIKIAYALGVSPEKLLKGIE
jgi:transcriptional regulator with XRE-family HTH domain